MNTTHPTHRGLSAFLASAALAVTSCSSPESAHSGADHHVDWTYSGARGPDHWGELGEGFTSCCHGISQSPIDIQVDREGNHIVEMSYAPSHELLVNNGHTIQLEYDNGSQLVFDGTPYNLLQFHFHTPSEHHLDGKAYALEAHLVHLNAEGDYLVVGVLFNEGSENPFLEQFIADAPEQPGRREMLAKLNVAELFVDDPGFYFYKGSFTTPPCTEGVTWLVIDRPNQASASQVKALSLLEGRNNRPEQTKGERQVEHFR